MTLVDPYEAERLAAIANCACEAIPDFVGKYLVRQQYQIMIKTRVQ